MKLARAEILALEAAFLRPLPIRRGEVTIRRGLGLRLIAEEGLEGVGEGSPAEWIGGAELADARSALEDVVRAVAAGATTEEVDRRIEPAVELSPAAACAIDTALVDLAARSQGVPLAVALGGAAAAARVEVSALLVSHEPEPLAVEAARAAGAGYRSVKMKVGIGSIDHDVIRLAAVRSMVGATVAIRVDANRAWDVADARRFLSRAAALDVAFVEEPLRNPTPEALAELRRCGLSIALDESVGSMADLDPYMGRAAADVLVVKAARLGGPRRAYSLARRAIDAGLRVVVTDSIELGVGALAAAHLAAALPAPRLAVGLGGPRLLATGGAPLQERPGRAFRGLRELPFLEVHGPGLTRDPDARTDA